MGRMGRIGPICLIGPVNLLNHKALRHMIVDDRNVLMLCVFFFPWRCFHLREWRAYYHLYVLAAQATRRATAVHRRVSAPENDDGLADLARVFERDAAEPVDTDMYVRGAFFAARDLQLAAPRRACTDKHRVVILLEDFLER